MSVNQSMGGLPYYLPRVLQVDPFGPNPLVTDLSVRSPRLFQLASERGPAPTLFATGDLPPFTASGVDPQLLNGLPYHWRHAAASQADSAVVLDWLEKCAQDPQTWGSASDGQSHPGLLDYQGRMEGWTRGLHTPDVSIEELNGESAYPDAFKSPAMRRAEAEADAEQQRKGEIVRLRDAIATESAKFPRNYDVIDQLADELAMVRAGGTSGPTGRRR